MGDPGWIAAAPSASEIAPVWIAAFGTLISATTLILTLYFRRRDSQSRMKIDYYLGDDPPRAWRLESELDPDILIPHEVLMVRVENVGRRNESLSDAYIDVSDGGVVHAFREWFGSSPKRESLQPGSPLMMHAVLMEVCSDLVEEGRTGTARGYIVVRLGRGDLHKKRIEISDVEVRAKGQLP